jgi:hypothetical protein
MNYQLDTRYDSRASFYGKATVEETYNADGTVTLTLVSYTTTVARIKRTVNVGDIGEAEVYGTYSQTTLRHIKEFLRQNGFKAETSKQIMEDYGV